MVTPGKLDQAKKRIPWDELSPEEQLRLRVDYGHYLEQLPPTCSLEDKNARFVRWLAAHGVLFNS